MFMTTGTDGLDFIYGVEQDDFKLRIFINKLSLTYEQTYIQCKHDIVI